MASPLASRFARSIHRRSTHHQQELFGSAGGVQDRNVSKSCGFTWKNGGKPHAKNCCHNLKHPYLVEMDRFPWQYTLNSNRDFEGDF